METLSEHPITAHTLPEEDDDDVFWAELTHAEQNWLTHHYNQPVIYGVTALIINQKNNVLLLLRNKAPQAGNWTIPGGKLKLNETFKMAINREAKEEVGVDIEVQRLLINTHPVDRINGVVRCWFSPVFLVSIREGIPKNCEPEAHSQMTWFPLNEIPNNLNQTTRVAINTYQQKMDSL